MTTPHDSWRRLVEQLELEPHPEGGFFRETWRSPIRVPGPVLPSGKPRDAATAILFLLPAGVRSNWHRVASDELWLHQAGDPVRLSVNETRAEDGQTYRLGISPCFQLLVPGGAWQTAKPEHGPHGFALVACVVVPGFEFEDFELAKPVGLE